MNVQIAIVVAVIVAVAAAGVYYVATGERSEEVTTEYVTVSGIVIYDGHDQGEILIGAYENIYLAPPGTIIGVEPLQQSVGAVSISAPGEYSFQVPANSGVVWVVAINDANNNGVFDVDVEPAGRYVGNPVTIGTQNISDVDITLLPGGLL